MIEAQYYVKKASTYSMSTEIKIDQDEFEIPRFWENATKYAHSVEKDDPFVEEMAYVMVTLHRHGV